MLCRVLLTPPLEKNASGIRVGQKGRRSLGESLGRFGFIVRRSFIRLRLSAAVSHVTVRKQINAHFIGKWKTTAIWGKKKITGSVEHRWSSDKTAVIAEGFQITDGKKLTFVNIMGWNGVAGEITKSGYASDGSTHIGAWTKLSDDGWQGYGKGIEDGVPWKSLERLEFREGSVRYTDQPQDDNPTYVSEAVRVD